MNDFPGNGQHQAQEQIQDQIQNQMQTPVNASGQIPWATYGILFFICLMVVMALASCAGMNTSLDHKEYRAGERDAETDARSDALLERKCINVYPRYQTPMINHRGRRLDAMGTAYSASYLYGYKSGYRRYFIRYMDDYCGR